MSGETQQAETEARHTPGPWTVFDWARIGDDGGAAHYEIAAGDEGFVGQVYHQLNPVEQRANAYLLAAAPWLYDLSARALAVLTGTEHATLPERLVLCAELKAALAAAVGEGGE